jgi:hypothetical protein
VNEHDDSAIGTDPLFSRLSAFGARTDVMINANLQLPYNPDGGRGLDMQGVSGDPIVSAKGSHRSRIRLLILATLLTAGGGVGAYQFGTQSEAPVQVLLLGKLAEGLCAQPLSGSPNLDAESSDSLESVYVSQANNRIRYSWTQVGLVGEKLHMTRARRQNPTELSFDVRSRI